MKLITGFFMAWGNFLSLPCPCKRWDNQLKNMMLTFLPSIGAVIGLLAIGVSYALNWISTPLVALGYTFYMYAICGFMHLDGFMDVNDAVLSRRPLEDKQRILKDSSIGAFAVVSLVFLILAFYVCSKIAFKDIGIWDLFMIPVMSRTCAGLWILCFKPMESSQYLKDSEDKDRCKYRTALVAQGAVYLALAVLLNGFLGGRTLAVVAIMFGASFLAVFYARKQLDGMNGDIAGYSICVSELVGIMALAVL